MMSEDHMREIKITRGFVTIVDDEDYDRLSKYHWCYHGGGDAARGYHENGKVHIEKMHQAIMGIAPEGYMIDHINGDKLDNRRCNLRFVTHQQNIFNSKPKITVKGKRCRSRFKGVTWRGDRGKWRSCITIDRKRHYIGLYDTEEEAAIAYNNAAIMLFGEYAKLNEI